MDSRHTNRVLEACDMRSCMLIPNQNSSRKRPETQSKRHPISASKIQCEEFMPEAHKASILPFVELWGSRSLLRSRMKGGVFFGWCLGCRNFGNLVTWVGTDSSGMPGTCVLD